MIIKNDYPEIYKLFIKNKGYCQLKELKEKKVHTSTVKKLLDNNQIEKIKPGLYKLTDYNIFEYSDYIDICNAIPDGIICLFSALSFYNLSTIFEKLIHVSIPYGKKAPKIIYPTIKVYNFRSSGYSTGIREIETKYGNFKIYNKEKTICDCLKNKNKIGQETIIEIFKIYVSQTDKDLNKLYVYSKIFKINKLVTQFIEILTG